MSASKLQKLLECRLFYLSVTLLSRASWNHFVKDGKSHMDCFACKKFSISSLIQTQRIKIFCDSGKAVKCSSCGIYTWLVDSVQIIESFLAGFIFHLDLNEIIFIVRWKVLGTLRSPNGIRTKQWRQWFDVSAVLFLSASSISICQNPLLASKGRFFYQVSRYIRSRIVSGQNQSNDCVELAKAHAKSEGSIFLGKEYYRCRSFPSCGLGDVLGEHLIDLSLFKFAHLLNSLIRCPVYQGRLWLSQLALFCHFGATRWRSHIDWNRNCKPMKSCLYA